MSQNGTNGTNGQLPPEVDGPRAAAQGTSGNDGPTAVVPPKTAARLEQQLTTQSVASTYVPSLPIYSARSSDWLNFEFFQDIEAMRKDGCIRLPLTFLLGAIAHGEWEIEGSSGVVAEFGAKQIQWWWANARGRVHEEGSIFGWCPGEVTYDVRDGLLVQQEFDTFHPNDADPMVMQHGPKKGKPVGVRIHAGVSGQRDLWAFRDDVPNKGFWYTHQGRHGMRRGQSQLRPAWRPWRRLMGRDGAEDIIDLGVYRNGIGDTIVGHPNQFVKATDSNQPAWATADGWHTRDEARQIAETRKAGSGIAIPSECDSNSNRKWFVETLETGVNIPGLVEYVDYLEQLCSKAMGVPPELLQAAESGSGYSGRAIPLQAFLTAQQRPLDDLTRMWLEQIGLPLVKWNFGPDAWIRITPVPLVESYRKSAWDGPGGQGQSVPSGYTPGGQPPEMGDEQGSPGGAPPVTTLATADLTMPVTLRVDSRRGVTRVLRATPSTQFLATDDLDKFGDSLARLSIAQLERMVGNDDDFIEADL